MPVTGLYFAPLPPASTSSSSILISHLRSRFPEQEPVSYYLDHRLFNDTSSQLPNSDPKSRTYTQTLTLSHSPRSTFVGSTSQSKDKSEHGQTPLSLITIPTSATDSFTSLIVTKLQPHWFHRQSVLVENGTSMTLKDGEWRMSVGDVRVSPRSQVGAGQLKGMIIEVTHLEDEEEQQQKPDGEKLSAWKKAEQTRFSSLLNAIFKGTGESFDAGKIVVARTGGVEEAKKSGTEEEEKTTPNWELARLYMEVLRGARG